MADEVLARGVIQVDVNTELADKKLASLGDALGKKLEDVAKSLQAKIDEIARLFGKMNFRGRRGFGDGGATGGSVPPKPPRGPSDGGTGGAAREWAKEWADAAKAADNALGRMDYASRFAAANINNVTAALAKASSEVKRLNDLSKQSQALAKLKPVVIVARPYVPPKQASPISVESYITLRRPADPPPKILMLPPPSPGMVMGSGYALIAKDFASTTRSRHKAVVDVRKLLADSGVKTAAQMRARAGRQPSIRSEAEINALIEKYAYLPAAIAKRKFPNLDQEALAAAGLVTLNAKGEISGGLMNAARLYDPNKINPKTKKPFAEKTYIGAAIVNAIRREAEKLSKVKARGVGGDEQKDFATDQREKLVELSRASVSASAKEKIALSPQMLKAIERDLPKLSNQRHQDVVRMRLGLYGTPAEKVEEIAKKLGFKSVQGVYQAYGVSMKRLRAIDDEVQKAQKLAMKEPPKIQGAAPFTEMTAGEKSAQAERIARQAERIARLRGRSREPRKGQLNLAPFVDVAKFVAPIISGSVQYAASLVKGVFASAAETVAGWLGRGKISPTWDVTPPPPSDIDAKLVKHLGAYGPGGTLMAYTRRYGKNAIDRASGLPRALVPDTDIPMLSNDELRNMLAKAERAGAGRPEKLRLLANLLSVGSVTEGVAVVRAEQARRELSRSETTILKSGGAFMPVPSDAPVQALMSQLRVSTGSGSSAGRGVLLGSTIPSAILNAAIEQGRANAAHVASRAKPMMLVPPLHLPPVMPPGGPPRPSLVQAKIAIGGPALVPPPPDQILPLPQAKIPGHHKAMLSDIAAKLKASVVGGGSETLARAIEQGLASAAHMASMAKPVALLPPLHLPPMTPGGPPRPLRPPPISGGPLVVIPRPTGPGVAMGGDGWLIPKPLVEYLGHGPLGGGAGAAGGGRGGKLPPPPPPPGGAAPGDDDGRIWWRQFDAAVKFAFGPNSKWLDHTKTDLAKGALVGGAIGMDLGMPITGALLGALTQTGMVRHGLSDFGREVAKWSAKIAPVAGAIGRAAIGIGVLGLTGSATLGLLAANYAGGGALFRAVNRGVGAALPFLGEGLGQMAGGGMSLLSGVGINSSASQMFGGIAGGLQGLFSGAGSIAAAVPNFIGAALGGIPIVGGAFQALFGAIGSGFQFVGNTVGGILSAPFRLLESLAGGAGLGIGNILGSMLVYTFQNWIMRIPGILHSWLIGTGAMMERHAATMAVMMRSAAQGQRMVESLYTMAATTPFEFANITQGANRLMAFGFQAREVMPMLQNIVDATSASPEGMEATLNRVILAFGHMRSRGVVSSRELNQLAMSGIPAWEMLATHMNVGREELFSMVRARAVSSAQAFEAIKIGIRERFGGKAIFDASGGGMGSLFRGSPSITAGIQAPLRTMYDEGVVTMEGMEQLRDRGIDAWGVLADKLGLSIGMTVLAVREGRVTIDQLMMSLDKAKVIPGMTWLPGMAERINKTWGGLISNIMDYTKRAGMEIGAPFFQSARQGLIAVVDWMGSNPGREYMGWLADKAREVHTVLRGMFDNVVQFLQPVLEPLKQAGMMLWEWVKPMLPFMATVLATEVGVRAVFWAISNVLSLFSPLRLAITAVMAAFTPEQIRGFFISVMTWVTENKDVFAQWGGYIQEIFKGIIGAAGSAARSLLAMMGIDTTGPWQDVANNIKNAITRALEAVSMAFQNLPLAWEIAWAWMRVQAEAALNWVGGKLREFGGMAWGWMISGLDRIFDTLAGRNEVFRGIFGRTEGENNNPNRIRGPFQGETRTGWGDVGRGMYETVAGALNIPGFGGPRGIGGFTGQVAPPIRPNQTGGGPLIPGTQAHAAANETRFLELLNQNGDADAGPHRRWWEPVTPEGITRLRQFERRATMTPWQRRLDELVEQFRGIAPVLPRAVALAGEAAASPFRIGEFINNPLNSKQFMDTVGGATRPFMRPGGVLADLLTIMQSGWEGEARIQRLEEEERERQKIQIDKPDALWKRIQEGITKSRLEIEAEKQTAAQNRIVNATENTQRSIEELVRVMTSPQPGVPVFGN